jgi:hypothetical protein
VAREKTTSHFCRKKFAKTVFLIDRPYYTIYYPKLKKVKKWISWNHPKERWQINILDRRGELSWQA